MREHHAEGGRNDVSDRRDDGKNITARIDQNNMAAKNREQNRADDFDN